DTAQETADEVEATLAWHVTRAEAALQSNDAFAAGFHLDGLIARRPDVPSLYVRRARVRVLLGRNDAALADLAHPSLRAMRDTESLMAPARACLVVGDRPGYAAACLALRRALLPDSNVDAVLAAAWTCALAAEGDGGQLLESVEAAARSRPGP